jgi:hypothetical protein
MHRVWIEIETPSDIDEGNKRAALVSAMLEKLGAPAASIWWHNAKGVYCITIDGSGAFLEMSDRGHWFDLEEVAK